MFIINLFICRLLFKYNNYVNYICNCIHYIHNIIQGLSFIQIWNLFGPNALNEIFILKNAVDEGRLVNIYKIQIVFNLRLFEIMTVLNEGVYVLCLKLWLAPQLSCDETFVTWWSIYPYNQLQGRCNFPPPACISPPPKKPLDFFFKLTASLLQAQYI